MADGKGAAMPEGAASGMTITGWIFLVIAWSGIIAATVFCFRRLLKSGQ